MLSGTGRSAAKIPGAVSYMRSMRTSVQPYYQTTITRTKPPFPPNQLSWSFHGQDLSPDLETRVGDEQINEHGQKYDEANDGAFRQLLPPTELGAFGQQHEQGHSPEHNSTAASGDQVAQTI